MCPSKLGLPDMKKKKRIRRDSIRCFPWSENINKDDKEILIEETAIEWYDAKHPHVSEAELKLINDLKIHFCPYCGGKYFVKNGHTRIGMQRYLCNDCGRRFNPLTNTIFDSKKIPISEWIEYLLHLFDFHSIKSSAYSNRNADSTGRFWLKKIFAVLEGIQDEIVLKDRIYLDETFVSKIKRKTVYKNGLKLRGISRSKIGIGVITDGEKSIFICTNTSKPSSRSTWITFSNHIKNGSTLIHDGERSHSVLIDRLNLKSVAYDASKIKLLKDEDNPLNPVNKLHSLLKRFLRAHGGYNRDELQDWLNLFHFIMNEPNNKYEKVKKFLEIALISPKKVTFRGVFQKSVDK